MPRFPYALFYRAAPDRILVIENGGISEDGLTITLHLRDDIKWSDGEPLTSDDIKFTIEVLSNPDSGALVGTTIGPLAGNGRIPAGLTNAEGGASMTRWPCF